MALLDNNGLVKLIDAMNKDINTKMNLINNSSLNKIEEEISKISLDAPNIKVSDLDNLFQGENVEEVLKELANALDNDLDFATTIKNLIEAKAEKNSVYTKDEVDEIVGSSTSIDDNTVNESNTWSSQKINAELNSKIDKEDGKGLSTNDFTTEEKDKLAGLSNYVHPDTEDMRHVTDDEKLAWNSKAEGNHRHSFSDIDDLPIGDVTKEYVDQELSKKSDVHTHPYKADDYVPSWDEVTGKPIVFEPSSHDHNDMYYDKNTVDEIIEPITDDYIDELFDKLDDTGNPIDFYSKAESDLKFATKEDLSNVSVDTSHLATKEELREGLSNVSVDTSHLATKEELSSLNSSLVEKTGNLTTLQTTNKSNLVGAINELFQNVDSGKQLIASAIGDSSVNKNSTFSAMSNAIGSIRTDIENNRNTLADLMLEGGYDITGNEDIDTLLDSLKISGINASDIKQIACNYDTTVILKHDGTVWGTGENEYGVLGLLDSNDRLSFTLMHRINNVKQIACGRHFIYAVKNDGSLWACGQNDSGQLGINSTTIHSNYDFVQVTTNINNDVDRVFCGQYYGFIIKTNGTVWACGSNSYGNLGLGDFTTQKVFKQVDISDVKDIITCANSTYVLKNDGSLWACGYNGYGQLGLGDTTNKTTFTKVTTNVKEASCGENFLMVVKNDNTLWACGHNGDGYLGIGGTDYSYYSPTLIQITTNVSNDVKHVSCGWGHTFIIKNDGSLWACGYGYYGQLGFNNTTTVTTFKQITTNMNNGEILQVVCGRIHSFILKKDSSIWSCGYNSNGASGQGSSSKELQFTKIARGL